MKLSPMVLAGFGLVIAFSSVLLATFVALSVPDLGFNATPHNDAIRVTSVDSWASDSGVKKGDIVIGIRSPLGDADLHPGLFEFARGPDKAARWLESEHIRNILTAREITLIRQDQPSITYEIQPNHRLSDLPLNYWSRCVYGIIAFIVGFSVWIWRPVAILNVLGMAAGFGLLLLWVPSAALMSGIAMHFPTPDYARLVMTLQSLGILIFAASFVCIPFYFPKEAPKAGYATGSIAILLLVYTLSMFFFNTPRNTLSEFFLIEPKDIYFLVIPLMLFGTYGYVIQVYRYWQEPVARAQQLWFLFAATVGPTAWLLLYLLPLRYGNGSLLPVDYAPLTILASYVMTMVGIWRHPSIKFEKHISTIYQWWITSILFLGIDLAFIYFAAFSPESALLLTLALMLWVYLPFRQWLVDRFNNRDRTGYRLSMNEAVTDLVEAMLSQQSPQTAWRNALVRGFSPVDLRPSDDGPTSIRGRGQLLHVTANDYSPSILLDSPEGGRRLFSDDDVQAIDSLQNLLYQLARRRDTFQAGQVIERQRISRDLHDQIGGKLLSIIYSAEDKRSRELARETMDQLREMLRALKKEPVPISNLEAEIKQLGEDVCSSQKIKFQWSSQLADGAALITTIQYLNLLNITRELLTNTVRHASADTIEIDLGQDLHSLFLRFRDSGIGFDRGNISLGNGVRNVESRVQEINGSISWEIDGQTLIEILVPHATDGLTPQQLKSEADYGQA